jgi:photosystem II stability/assembly factor-like uncharacterized protein
MSDRIYVGTRKGLFTLDRQNGKWRVSRKAFVGDHVSMVLPDRRDSHVYASLGHGHFGVKFQRSTNAGDSWEESTSPKFPPKPEGAEPDLCPMRKIPIPWNVEIVWALEAGGNDQPGKLWCGTAPGGLFTSDDHGQSWSLVRSLWDHPSRKQWFGGGLDFPAIHSILVDPRNSRRVMLAISCGGVWQTTDAGESWETRSKGIYAAFMPPEERENPNIQDVHRLAWCATNPEAMWAQHHNGIFHSTDGGREWHDVTTAQPTNFGFAVAVHPQDGKTAWFAPELSDERRVPVEGKLVVSRTRDGGKSFEVLSRGLPQENAYDEIYRHALDVDATGDRLVMGSTTGGVWISENQGESWENVAPHLPPVYCTRFG